MSQDIESFPSGATRELASSLAASLGECARVLRTITEAVYTDRQFDPAFGSCIGGHMRHSLDHARILLKGMCEQRPIDYEARERGGRVETEPSIAADEAERLAEGLAGLADLGGDTPCVVVLKPSADAECVRIQSTLARELAFVASHTIHHQAMIGMLLARAGTEVTGSFGLAHGTPRVVVNGSTRCAR
jgi:uncharacterized damage-inducible protein DinB